MVSRANHHPIKTLASTVLSILLLLLIEITAASADRHIITENSTLSSLLVSPQSESDVVFTSFSNMGSYSYLKVDVTQTSGANGVVTVTFVGQKTPDIQNFFQNNTKCYFSLADKSMTVDTNRIFSRETDFSSIEAGNQISLSTGAEQQTLTGNFTVNAPGTYRFFATLTGTDIKGSSTVTFRLEGNSVPSVTINDRQDQIIPLDTFIPWEGLNLTVQNIEPASSDVVKISYDSDSLHIKGVKEGEVTVNIHVMFNGRTEIVPLTIQVDWDDNPWFEWIRHFFARFSDGNQVIDAEFIPLIILLAVFILCFIWLLYLNFIKRIPGSFMTRCECGGISFEIAIKSPPGRAITLYKLLNKMLKQHKNHDADVIRKIANDNDNERALKKTRIYIVKDSYKKSHYAFLKAESNEFLDNTLKQVYPDSGRRNTNLTVYLSFRSNQ